MRWRSDHTAAGAAGSIMHGCSLFVAWNGKWGEFEEGSLHYFLPSSQGMISSRRAASIDIPVNVARVHFSLPSLVKSPLFCHDLGPTVSSLFSLFTRRMNFPSKLNEMITAATAAAETSSVLTPSENLDSRLEVKEEEHFF